MKTTIVRIGNSRGVRIPKPVLQQCALENEVEMEVRGQELVIRSANAPRQGWDDAFRRMAQQGDDRAVLQLREPSTEWADEDWQW